MECKAFINGLVEQTPTNESLPRNLLGSREAVKTWKLVYQ
jgi:hypothetical protein